MRFLYDTAVGRMICNVLFRAGILKLVSKYLESKHSRWLIKKYIKKYSIDMSRFENREYTSFADFFGREKTYETPASAEDKLISPCDGLLSVYGIEENSKFTIKGIDYTLDELIPDKSAHIYKNGLCLVFRLEAKDYHHFCYIDDCVDSQAVLIPGKLHSVQPVAIENLPVFRQNKRYYHIMDTGHFGKVMQVEVGAVLVGDVSHAAPGVSRRRGEESGKFKLLGSTIVLLLTKDYRDRIEFNDSVKSCVNGAMEYPVGIGEEIGTLL